MSAPTPRRVLTFAFFAGILLLYLAFSPFSVAGMGYIGEEMNACRQIGSRLQGGHDPVEWPRNGAAGLLFQCPFMAAGDALLGASTLSEDAGLSWQPAVLTALLVTLVFVWGSGLAQSRAWGFLLATATGFATLLWPYAYIGLETTQSLFLLVAGFLALDDRAPRSWGRCVLFGICAGIAVGVKSGGVLLLPAAAYLAWCLFRGCEDEARPSAGKAAVTLAIIVLLFAANAYVRHIAWARYGGAASFAALWLVRDPISPLLNLMALLASPNKGLFLYAPLTLLALIALPRAFRAAPRAAVFAVLTLLGLAGGLSLLGMWSDETWGPRYLHSAVAPLVLCLAASKRDRPVRLRLEPALVLAVAIGLAVSFLGVAFYYGTLMAVATTATTPTLETLQTDMTWNHVRFNGRLLRVWLRSRQGAAYPQYLPAGWFWSFRRLEHAPDWKRVELTPFAHPQPLLLQALEPRSTARRAAPGLAAALIAGVALLVFVRRAS